MLAFPHTSPCPHSAFSGSWLYRWDKVGGEAGRASSLTGNKQMDPPSLFLLNRTRWASGSCKCVEVRAMSLAA